jgi:hypothetical protein
LSLSVYSSQFFVYTPSTPNLTYDVPEGYTAVVRDLDGYQEIGGYVCALGFRNSEAAPQCQPVVLEAAGTLNTVTWRGRLVVPGGGQLTLSLSAVGEFPSIYVGGYLLRN